MGTTYYVSAATGNNNNPGNQPDKPLRTIQAAINKAQAGDRVTVSGGTYAERLHIRSLAQSTRQSSLPIQKANRPSSMARTS